MSADLVFQEVINLAIKGSALSAYRSGAMPPKDGTFPYIQFGQSVEADDFAHGSSITAEVHVWSTLKGPHEVKNIQQQIKDLLQKCEHVRGGFQFTAVRQSYKNVFLDVDSETWHGVQKFRALASVV